MRRTFIVMRHAKSDWGQAGLADHDRPLNQRGRRASKAMAHVLAEHDFIVDVILASTAVRVQETVQRLQRTWSPHAEVLSQRELYLASPDEMARSIHALHDSWARVLLVGHNPGIAALATWLSGQQLEMPTAAVAVFEAQAETWQNTLQADTWKLKAYWKPRDFE
ncbi:MAG: histidine phosphatase family protein [Pirellulaceae bacterium]